MKQIFLGILLAVAVFAAGPAVHADSDLTRTPGNIANQVAVQYIAPDALTKALSVNTVTYDLSTYLLYRLIIPAGTTTCQVRTMATSTKPVTTTGTGQAAIFPASQVVVSAKNVGKPFVNFSGCTSSYLQIQ